MKAIVIKTHNWATLVGLKKPLPYTKQQELQGKFWGTKTPETPWDFYLKNGGLPEDFDYEAD